MSDEEFYAEKLETLKTAQTFLLQLIDEYPETKNRGKGLSPIIQCQSRIKSVQSMIQKLERYEFEVNLSSALTNVYDAVGIRIICGFIDDVYLVAQWLKQQSVLKIVQSKDYVSFPKPNGYRSYHLCLQICEGPAAGTLAEIQIRTMALDFWATLEHQLKYKKEIPNEELIRSELKRCADEIAATDISMQTIRDMLEGGLICETSDDHIL